MDVITKTLNELMNAKRAGKTECRVSLSSNLLLEVLELMKNEGYVDYKVEKGGKFPRVLIAIKKVNECRAIRPRLHFQIDEFQKYVRRFLPSRDLGIVIVSTDKGVLSHKDALDKGVGGVLLAYCY